MLSCLLGVLLCVGLLAGCSGSQVNLVKPEPVQEDLALVPAADQEESLAEELNPRRLEELYAKSGIPGWDPGLEEELKKWDHQLSFDFPIQMNRQVRAYLVYFSTERKEIFTRYLSRSTRYLPMIKEIFQENGLPDDLAYLAMIESGFNNKAYSPAAASGMWQFIRGTGLRYGLAIDSYVDERRDPEKATRAAAKYLLDLYKQFGSWYLAAASYNCGEGRVQRELNQSTHKNFWELSDNMCLPNETKNYVPQMIAATIIAKNPEKFGFRRVPYLPPLALDKIQVNEPTSLKAASVAVNVPVDEMQALNPELLRGVTPPEGPYTLKLPRGSKLAFSNNIMLARIEHPAVASRPTRLATGSSRATHVRSEGRSGASHSHKSKTAAKSGKKGTTHVAQAKNGKSGAKGGTVQASMLGKSSGSAKKSAAAPHKSSQQTAAKGKAKTQTGKDSGNMKLAKKGDSSAKKASSRSKTSGKNNTVSQKSKSGKSKSEVVAQAR